MRLSLFLSMVLVFHSITYCQNQPADENNLYRAWVREYAGPLGWETVADIAVDQSGNVYLASQSFDSTTSYDYVIIKYSSGGTEEWAARYTKPGWDLPEAVTIDTQGNVYVTGRSEESYETVYDIFTIKYDSDGVEQWTARYNGPGNHWDQGTDITVDQSGNVYVVGHVSFSHTSPFNENYATIKYSSQGDQEWIAFYDGPVGLNDKARVLAVDDSGNVYVTGSSVSSTYPGSYSFNYDYLTVKYDSDGVEQWTARYDGPAHEPDGPREIALDDSGNVYVTGTSTNRDLGDDYATIKYSSDGEELWVARYSGPGYSQDQAYGLARDNSGNIYVTGSTGFDYATIKYDSDGIERWIAIYEGPPHTYGRAVDIVVDDLGYVFIFGWVLKYDGSNHDYALVRYDSSGTESATVTYNTHPNTDDWAEAMAMDGDGNIYVTGSGNFQGSPRWTHIFTVKYTQLPLSIVGENNSYPKEPQLYQNYPNPLNSSTRISYSVSNSGFVTLKIFDILGREIETLVSEFQETGIHSTNFDAGKLSSGIYFYGLRIDDRFAKTKKMLVIR